MAPSDVTIYLITRTHPVLYTDKERSAVLLKLWFKFYRFILYAKNYKEMPAKRQDMLERLWLLADWHFNDLRQVGLLSDDKIKQAYTVFIV